MVLQLLRESDFRRLWFSSGLWWQAMWIEQIAIGWLALMLTDSAWWVAVIGFLRSVPLPIAGLFGSSLTERFLRRRVICAAQLAGTLAVGAATALYFLGTLSYWHLGFVAFVRGSAWALEWPARRGLIPDLVGRTQVVDAMMMENILQGLSKVAGPLLAGWALSALGVGGALTLLTILLAGSFICVASLATDSRSPEPPVGLVGSLRRVAFGFRYMRTQPAILGVLIGTAVMNMWCFPYQTLLPVFARDVLGQGPMGLGFLGSAVGVGSIVGLALVNLVKRKISNEFIFAASSALCCLGLVAFSASGDFVLSLIMLIVAGVGMAGFSIMQSSIILLESSDDMRTRTMSMVVLAIGFGPAGQAQGGAIAEAWGAPLAVGGMALCACLSMGIIAFAQRSSMPLRQRNYADAALVDPVDDR